MRSPLYPFTNICFSIIHQSPMSKELMPFSSNLMIIFYHFLLNIISRIISQKISILQLEMKNYLYVCLRHFYKYDLKWNIGGYTSIYIFPYVQMYIHALILIQVHICIHTLKMMFWFFFFNFVPCSSQCNFPCCQKKRKVNYITIHVYHQSANSPDLSVPQKMIMCYLLTLSNTIWHWSLGITAI